MQNYLDTNDCFHMISLEFEFLPSNFYSTAKLVHFLWSYYSVVVIKAKDCIKRMSTLTLMMMQYPSVFIFTVLFIVAVLLGRGIFLNKMGSHN